MYEVSHVTFPKDLDQKFHNIHQPFNEMIYDAMLILEKLGFLFGGGELLREINQLEYEEETIAEFKNRPKVLFSALHNVINPYYSVELIQSSTKKALLETLKFLLDRIFEKKDALEIFLREFNSEGSLIY